MTAVRRMRARKRGLLGVFILGPPFKKERVRLSDNLH
jgi:hypothetical protein